MSYASVHFDAPPSANKIWRPGEWAMFKTKVYDRWKASAGKEVMVARKGGLKFVEPIEVIIMAARQNVRADIDNLIKPTLDALQFGQIIENDSQVECVVARWATAHDLEVMNGRDVRVEIRSCT